MLRFYNWLIINLFCVSTMVAQDSLRMEILTTSDVKLPIYKHHFNTNQQIYNELDKQLNSWRGRGYIEASFDTVYWEDRYHAKAILWTGKQYHWKYFNTDSISKELLSAAGFRRSTFETNRLFLYKDWNKLSDRLLSYLENNGYPFAQVHIDSLQIDSSGDLSGILKVDEGQLFRWGDITVHPPPNKKRTRIQKGYLRSYLSLLPNRPYDESRIQKIERRLRELPFLRTNRSPYIVFEEGKAHVHLFLENQRASEFDVLIGLMPNDDPITKKTKIELTGLVNIDLLNSFGLGERVKLKWQQLRKGITELEFQFQYPYIARLPLGADLRFKLYKRDTTYIDIIFDVGAQYLFGGNNYLKVFWNSTTTNLIFVDTQRILQTKRLPALLDTRLSTFGLEYSGQSLDYRYNPRKGFEWKLIGGFSLKRIRPNVAITELTSSSQPDFDFAALYDSISTRTFLYKLSADYSHYFQLWRWSTLMARARIGWVGSPAPILQSESFRLGGNRFLRGFDEESIFANWYNVLTLEWRFIFGTNSYAYLFGEGGYLEYKQDSQKITNIPYGFGVGVVLGTKIGLFGLSYALGSQQGNPLIIKNAKIHFGYVGLF